MNIKRAKEQIKNAMTVYYTKDELGNYVIPLEKQRPVFLIGPPGIGKTAIMEQIAVELKVGLVSYSMTHHTRQSAIGLPFISSKVFKNKSYDITEYTMSEILASVYELMEESGIDEGILFLDEINCVSETLSPLMLQFLQYKIFGRHKLPEGWIIVTAGNPPEYNNSVHEFDVVTMDRLKIIEVEPDYETWKEYAYKAGIHGAIISFLDVKQDCFYSVESTIEGKRYVTPRGWEDLSRMLHLYEEHSLEVNEDLIVQYLRNPKISKEFAAYYDLYKKYQSDYQIVEILSGRASESLKEKASKAKFDELYALMGLLLDNIGTDLRSVIKEKELLESYKKSISEYQVAQNPDSTPREILETIIKKENDKIEINNLSGAFSRDERIMKQKTISFLEDIVIHINGEEDYKKSFKIIKKDFDKEVKSHMDSVEKAKEKLSHFFAFVDECWGEGQEMLIAVTELTANYYSACFISTYGCDEYFKHNKSLLFQERHLEISKEIESLGL